VDDPKDNTGVQRSWLPFKDKGLVFAEENLRMNEDINTKSGFITGDPLQTYKANLKQSLPYDIATSLAIGGKNIFRKKYYLYEKMENMH